MGHLNVRAVIGLGLLAVAPGAAVAIAGTALSLRTWAAMTLRTTGFDALLATFLPAAFALLVACPGWIWWHDRHPEDPDAGRPTCRRGAPATKLHERP